MVLATKVYGDMGDWPNEGRLSALNIRRACDASLRRLQTDYIDLYQMHHIDRRHPLGRDLAGDGGAARPGQDPLRRLHQLRRLAHRPGPGGRRAAQLHGPGQRAVPLQPPRPRRRARGPAGRRDYGLGVIPWSPLAAGCSAASCARSATGSRRYGEQHAATLEAKRAQLERYEDLCAELGEEPGTVGLAWLLPGRR